MRKLKWVVMGLVGLCAMGVQAEIFTITDPDIGDAGTIYSSVVDGKYVDEGVARNRGELIVGETEGSPDLLNRVIIKIGIPADQIAPGTQIARATLRLYVMGQNLAASGAGSLVLFSAHQPDEEVRQYGVFDWSRNISPLGVINGLDSSTPPGWVEFDVTEAVQKDLDKDAVGEQGSSFSLKLNNDLSLVPNDGTLVWIRFGAPRSAKSPELVIETASDSEPKLIILG